MALVDVIGMAMAKAIHNDEHSSHTYSAHSFQTSNLLAPMECH
jgi:hypothetical protein